MERSADSWGAFLGWSVAGVGMGVGVLSILTIGPFVMLLTLFLCGVLLWRPGPGPAMTGVISGAAAPPLWVAWLNRDGPGNICTRTATSTSCLDEWSPWPFVAVALVLLVVGVAVFGRLRRR
jgi:hypothetical protein